MQRGTFLSIFGVLTVLIAATTAIFLYARGYRLDFKERSFTTTGMILAKSQPEGARVFLDGELAAATNSTISGLTPGFYQLRLEKDGYFSWEKNIEVKAELVTSISVLLPPLSPSLTAITREGAQLITLAPSSTKAAFVSQDKLFLLPLTNQFLGFIRTNPQEIGKLETEISKVTEILFSPNEDQILVFSSPKSILFTLGQNAPQTVADPATLKENWRKEALEQKTETIARLDVPEEMREIALSPTTAWSPDEKKILYTKDGSSGLKEYWVANFTDPLPVGDNTNQKIWETDSANLKLFWLANSYNFTMLENETISLLDIDGTNKRDLFKGSLVEPIALSSSDLSQIIILTSISPNSPANLYGISLK